MTDSTTYSSGYSIAGKKGFVNEKWHKKAPFPIGMQKKGAITVAETFKKETAPGFLHVENRKELRAGGIEHVETCDSHLVTARIHMGRLAVRGVGLTMQKLDAEKGEMTLLGRIDSVQYLGGGGEKQGGFFRRLLR